MRSQTLTLLFGAGGSISEPSESEWLRDTEAEECGAKNEQISILISVLQNLDHTVYKTENTLLPGPSEV